MGKPGKKAGKGMMPPTNVNRTVSDGKTHLRDKRTVKRLKMYTSKVVRNEKGEIVKGSVLSAADRVQKNMARIAPDRRWFGNTRVIGQQALQKFRTEMNAKYNDPYSVVVKQSKLPLSLLEEPKEATGEIQREMQWEQTFGPKATRKRARLGASTVEEMVAQAAEEDQQFEGGITRGKIRRDIQHNAEYATLAKPASTMPKKKAEALAAAKQGTREATVPLNEANKESATHLINSDPIANRSLYRKGMSNRIWNELYKVIDSADVICYVVDARDPMGTRSPFIEHFMRTEKRYKHFVFVLNKCDLIPVWATARWLQILSKDFPTVAMHSSVTHPFGKGNLISLLRQFSRLHNVAHRGSKRTKAPISVGVIGYPNVGKSSVINTLRRKMVCKSAPIPGETKVWQYVSLTRSIFLIDSPGVVSDREGNNDVQAVLKGVVRIERLGGIDKSDVVHTVLQICRKEDIVSTYGIQEWKDVHDFLDQLALRRGKLLPGGVPDSDIVARSVLYDWQRGRIPWYNAPPYESNQKFREAQELPAGVHLKAIEHYNTFNVVDDKLQVGIPGEAPPDAGHDDHSGSDDEEEEEEEEGEEGGDKKTKKRRTEKTPVAAKATAGSSSRASGGPNKAGASSANLPYETVASVQARLEEEERVAARKAKARDRRQATQPTSSAADQKAAAAAKKGKAQQQKANDDDLWDQFVNAA